MTGSWEEVGHFPDPSRHRPYSGSEGNHRATKVQNAGRHHGRGNDAGADRPHRTGNGRSQLRGTRVREPRRRHHHRADQRQRGRRHLRPGLHAGLRGRHAGRHARSTSTCPRARRSTDRPDRRRTASTRRSTTTRTTSSCPAPTRAAADYTLTQAQIDYLGDELADQIVAVDEEHFGPMDAADPADPASDSLVMLVYNVQDDELLRLRRDHLHGRLLRTGLHRQRSGMNVIVHRRVRLGQPRRRTRHDSVERRRPGQRPARAVRGRHRARARAPAA